MNKLLTWKVLGYVLALFVAGAVSGSLVTYPLSNNKKPAGRPAEFNNFIWQRLKSRLDLTADQQEKIKPLVDKAGEQMKDCRDGVVTRIHQINEDLNAKLTPILTPEQREKLQQMAKEPAHREHNGGENRRNLHGASNEDGAVKPSY